MGQLELFITCAKSQEDLLALELEQQGISQTKIQPGGVAASATQEQALALCLWSRIANRVLLKLQQFDVKSEDSLYQQLLQFPWHEHLSVENTFAVSCTLHKSQFTHSKFLALKTKDAIVDYFRNREDQRPSVNTDQPDLQFNVYISGQQATLYLDLSGDSLH
ncbi:MAG: THUMP domain-containing protein, partial [Gammaproteobacteria bacterium]|nr:THUMP domain-containing protein [Gammaproteobacteria bacterium]